MIRCFSHSFTWSKEHNICIFIVQKFGVCKNYLMFLNAFSAYTVFDQKYSEICNTVNITV